MIDTVRGVHLMSELAHLTTSVALAVFEDNEDNMERLTDDLGDVLAALGFFIDSHGLDRARIEARGEVRARRLWTTAKAGE